MQWSKLYPWTAPQPKADTILATVDSSLIEVDPLQSLENPVDVTLCCALSDAELIDAETKAAHEYIQKLYTSTAAKAESVSEIQRGVAHGPENIVVRAQLPETNNSSAEVPRAARRVLSFGPAQDVRKFSESGEEREMKKNAAAPALKRAEQIMEANMKSKKANKKP